MRIAQVAPLYESVPPQGYGGTERIVSYLTDELVRRGHRVTLFASEDSRSAAALAPMCPRALRLAQCQDPLSHHIVMIEHVLRRAGEFDIIHFHTGYVHFPAVRRVRPPNITTLHGRLDLAEFRILHKEFAEMPVVAISDAQRASLPGANFLGTVLHGLPLDLYRFQPEPGDYFAFLGRVSPEKRLDRAIQIASAVNIPLKVAAKIDRVDLEYYERHIAPMLDNPLVEMLGEIGDDRKQEFLGRARALLFPVDWPEPFGLVMIEAMACGTPVIAYRQGSVPEVIDPGVTGFVVNDLPSAIEAAAAVGRLDRGRCREQFEQRFGVARMADDYLRLYAAACPEPAAVCV